MIGNLVLLLIVLGLTGLLYRFPLRHAQTPAIYRILLIFFGVLVLAALLNGLLAWLGLSGLRLASSRPPITTVNTLTEVAAGDGVIVAGEVSAQNPALYHGEYAAYADDGGHLWSPSHLWIDVQGGRIAITNTTYRASDWPMDASRNAYLRVKQPVIVVGLLEQPPDFAREHQEPTMRADMVYAGSADEFLARARWKMILPAVMLLANAGVIILILVFMLPRCVKGMKKN